MIKIKNLSRTFDFKVLDNIDCEFECGKIYILKGISGSGKTTLLNILAGLDNGYTGECSYCGKDLKKLTKKENKQYRNGIGYILQDSLLISHMNVIDNLRFIEDNNQKILYLARNFEVEHLLYKMPYQLSGGERQRFSLIRSLLGNSKIILADEPTSSLDMRNSMLFAAYLNELRKNNKILIIATHKNIYDTIADKIYNIQFGRLKEIKGKVKNTKTIENKKNNIVLDTEFKFNLKYNLKYLILRTKKNKSIILNIFLVLLFVLLFFSLAIRFNFKNEYIQYNMDKYPYNVLSLTEKDYKYLEELIVRKYDEYVVFADNYNGYVLPNKEDSNFNIPGIIKYGVFPQSSNEILINNEFANLYFPNEKLEKVINKQIEINENNFLISGIVMKDSNNYFEVYGCNPYYKNINKGGYNEISLPAIFIPYDTIIKIGKKIESNISLKLVVIDKKITADLYNDKIFTEASKPVLGNYRSWENKIDSVSKDANFFANMFLLLLLFISIVSILFVSNKIGLDLYYRKRELGYLQLFRLSKTRIFFIYVGEYLLNIIKPLFISLILYNIFCLLIYLLYGFNLFLSIEINIALVLVILIYCIIIITIPMLKYMKKDIIELIR